MQADAQTIELSTGLLHYSVRGAGRPLVYLHPAGGLRLTPVVERLAEAFQVILPIAPGFDGTPYHAGIDSAAGLAQVAAEFIESVVGGPTDVIGHSLGARQALWLAVQRPDLVDHIVVEAPDGLTPAPAFPRDLEELRKLLFTHPERAAANPKGDAVIAENAAAASGYAPHQPVDADLLERLPNIDRLTLILQGTDDRICPTQSVQLLRRLLRRSYLTYIWDAAHSPEVDQPDRTFSIIESFLTRSEAFMVNWGTLAVSRG